MVAWLMGQLMSDDSQTQKLEDTARKTEGFIKSCSEQKQKGFKGDHDQHLHEEVRLLRIAEGAAGARHADANTCTVPPVTRPLFLNCPLQVSFARLKRDLAEKRKLQDDYS